MIFADDNPFSERAKRAIENWKRVRKKYGLNRGQRKIPQEVQKMRMEKADAKRLRKRKARLEAQADREVVCRFIERNHADCLHIGEGSLSSDVVNTDTITESQ